MSIGQNIVNAFVIITMVCALSFILFITYLFINYNLLDFMDNLQLFLECPHKGK